jgi:hypothetical protein
MTGATAAPSTLLLILPTLNHILIGRPTSLRAVIQTQILPSPQLSFPNERLALLSATDGTFLEPLHTVPKWYAGQGEGSSGGWSLRRKRATVTLPVTSLRAQKNPWVRNEHSNLVRAVVAHGGLHRRPGTPGQESVRLHDFLAGLANRREKP